MQVKVNAFLKVMYVHATHTYMHICIYIYIYIYIHMCIYVCVACTYITFKKAFTFTCISKKYKYSK